MDHLDAWESGVWKKELEKQLEEDRLKMANVDKLENLVIILNREGKAFYPDFRWYRTDNSTITLLDKQCLYNSMSETRKSTDNFNYKVAERGMLRSLLGSELGIGRHKKQPIYVENGDINCGKVLKIHCQDFSTLDDIVKKAEAVYGKALKKNFGEKGIKLERRPLPEAYLAALKAKSR